MRTPESDYEITRRIVNGEDLTTEQQRALVENAVDCIFGQFKNEPEALKFILESFEALNEFYE